MGFGNGFVIAASVMASGALFAGWGLTQLATSDGGFIQALQSNHAPVEAPVNPGEKNAGGGSAAQQPSEGGTGKRDENGAIQGPTPGRGDEDKPNGSGAPAEAKPAPKAKPYTIKPGDTLTAISGTTGAPIGI
ncbi:hypothetical protein [Streptomyces aureocirculatus]|uniref:hypothetical protein n=1 Tax=Streptomyces aureocirculatus TaxID=67275 RepID=UPI0004C8C87D|nr:hypothetical protein [Streptomyces aureocirculatus]